MPYIGNVPKYGDTASNFKTLDDIKSYVWTFDASLTSFVDINNDTLMQNSHRFVQGQRVTYNVGSGNSIGGLSNNNVYYVIKYNTDKIKLAADANAAASGTAINLTSLGSGNHTLTVAFDGVNKEFKPTWKSGAIAKVVDPGQLLVSINGTMQKPNIVSPSSEGFSVSNGNILFSTAPTSADVFWGQMIASKVSSFDVSDNRVDNFTGDGTTTNFGLSKAAPTNASVLVTIDGVTQYPTEGNVVKAYSIFNNSVLSFTAAPALGVEIQVRHIGFASPITGSVDSFNGRQGNVSLAAGDPLVGVGINSTGNLIGVGVTMLNFVGAGNTFLYNAGTHTVDISIAGGGGGGSGEIDKQTFNVTANQTVFNLTEKYTTGYIDVYVNGVRLSSADFTETDDDTITLVTAAVAGDVVDFVSHSVVAQNTILESELTNLNVTGITTTNNLNITGTTTGTIHDEKRFTTPDFVFETKSNNIITNDTTLTATSNHTMFTKVQEVEISDGKFLEITDGDSFVIDAYNFG